MRSIWTSRRRRGQGLAEVAVVCSIMSSMAGGGAGAAWQVLGTAQRTVAINQMKQIYLAVTMAADDNDGRLPSAVMYPDLRADPNAVRNNPRSIVRIMGNGVPANMWVAPRAPQVFQRAGLTYIWNSALNGQLVDQVDPHTWLMMDMNGAAYAIPDLVPRSEGGYLVLYADGSVKYEMQPPRIVPPGMEGQLQDSVANGTPLMDVPLGGGQGGAAPAVVEVVPPEPVDVKDPQTAINQKEEAARSANPDEDDALDE